MSRVNILGEALDGLGRWYVAVPPFLIIGFLAALFFLTGAGQARLQEASERLQNSAERTLAIEEVQSSVARFVSLQRAFLLTGDQKFLVSYDRIVDDVEPRLERLQSAYEGGAETDLAETAHAAPVDRQAARRPVDVDRRSEIAGNCGRGRAPENQRRHGYRGCHQRCPGSPACPRIRGAQRGGQSLVEVLDVEPLDNGGRNDFQYVAGGVAARLVYMDLRRRTLQTAELRDQKLQLEREAEERTRELVELSTHLQSVAEREKAGLARELHDELGGLLVGACMDISWAEQHLAQDSPDIKQRLQRVQQKPVGRCRSEAAHHRGIAADSVGQCRIVRRVALAIERDLRQRRFQMRRVVP